MRRSSYLIIVLSAVFGLTVGLFVLGERESGSAELVPGSVSSGTVVSSTARDGAGEPRVKPSTRTSVGEYRIRGGRTLRLETADTADGFGCLFDIEDGHAAGSSCFEGGLFAQQKLAYAIHFDGGPDRFGALYVIGVAAPGIAAVSLSMTDGSTVRLALSRGRAFLYESSKQELERDVLPAGLDAFGPSGKLVEQARFPGLG